MSRRRQLKVTTLCPTPDKVRFMWEDEAEKALWAIWYRVRLYGSGSEIVPERVYLCACGGFHLTKRKAEYAY